MIIQEHLAVFDSWLSSRIADAHAAGKDLAFRDRAGEIRLGEINWEYNFLVPGQRAPKGEGWSVYRLHGIDAEHVRVDPMQDRGIRDRDVRNHDTQGTGVRRRLLGVFSGALFGADRR